MEANPTHPSGLDPLQLAARSGNADAVELLESWAAAGGACWAAEGGGSGGNASVALRQDSGGADSSEPVPLRQDSDSETTALLQGLCELHLPLPALLL